MYAYVRYDTIDLCSYIYWIYIRVRIHPCIHLYNLFKQEAYVIYVVFIAYRYRLPLFIPCLFALC
jgi:hypothetical protein